MRYVCICLLLLGGCSARYWGGENAGQTPGVHWRSPSLLSPAEFNVTSDCNADIGCLKYRGSTATQPSEVVLQNAKFGQQPSVTLKEIPAAIDATTRLQYTQVQYIHEVAQGVIGLAHELMPLFNLLAMANVRTVDQGLQLTLPNGLSVGGKKVSSPADLSTIIRAMQNNVQAAAATAVATTQPGG